MDSSLRISTAGILSLTVWLTGCHAPGPDTPSNGSSPSPQVVRRPAVPIDTFADKAKESAVNAPHNASPDPKMGKKPPPKSADRGNDMRGKIVEQAGQSSAKHPNVVATNVVKFRPPSKAAPQTRFAFRGIIPGLQSVLMLTDEQKKKVVEIRKEALASDEVVAARKTLTNKKATLEERKSAMMAFQRANADAKKKIDALMTDDQKELLRKVRKAFQESMAEAQKEFQARAPALKNDQTKLRALQQEVSNKGVGRFFSRLNKFLTPEQKEALKLASANIKAQIERAKSKSKAPSKAPRAPELN